MKFPGLGESKNTQKKQPHVVFKESQMSTIKTHVKRQEEVASLPLALGQTPMVPVFCLLSTNSTFYLSPKIS